MDPYNPGSVNSTNLRLPASPLLQPSTPANPAILMNPPTPASITTSSAAEESVPPQHGVVTSGALLPQMDIVQSSPAPATPLPNAAVLLQPSPASASVTDSMRQIGQISASNPLLASLVERGSDLDRIKLRATRFDELTYKVDTSRADVLSLLKLGEEMLTEIVTRVSDTVNTGRALALPQSNDPRDQELIRKYTFAFGYCEKLLPLFFRRLRLIQDAVSLEMVMVADEVLLPKETVLPLRDEQELGSDPSGYEDELKKSVRPKLWEEYLALKQTLRKRDDYLKTIVDQERAMLHQMNCMLFPS